MKKRNIFLGVILAFSLTSCFDMDKMPEGVLSTAQPFSSTGEMRNYLDRFYQIGNPKYEDDKIKVNFGNGLRGQDFGAGGSGDGIAGSDINSDNMSSSSVSSRLVGETTLSGAAKLTNYTAIRNLNFLLANLDNCVEQGSPDYDQYEMCIRYRSEGLNFSAFINRFDKTVVHLGPSNETCPICSSSW